MDAIVHKFGEPIPKNIDAIIISQSNDLNSVNTTTHTSSIPTKGE